MAKLTSGEPLHANGMQIVIALLVALILLVLLSRVPFRPRINHAVDDAPTIFVGIASFGAAWIPHVQQLLLSAAKPYRLRVGVVEYVSKASESGEPDIPDEWRPLVTVYAVSKRLASTLRKARALCLEKTAKGEAYTLFAIPAAFESGWDETLIQMCAASQVVSCALGADASFAVVSKDLTIRHRRLMNQRCTDAVPVLLTSPDLMFCASEVAPHLLRHTNPWNTTALLQERGCSVKSPALRVATKADTRGSVPVGKGAIDSGGKRYAASVGVHFDTMRASPHARLGITAAYTPEEAIAKHGSVVATRVKLQTLEAGRADPPRTRPAAAQP